MRYLLAALNAKYIHSNLGIYSLKAYAQKRHPSAEILLGEYTINHQPGDILADIYRKKPDFLGFSCYIWNVETVRRLARDVKKILPDTAVWLGGPEVSYDAGQVLKELPGISGVMAGEGEETFSRLAGWYEAGGGEEELSRIPGLVFRAESGEIVSTGPAPLMDLDDIPFPYGGLEGLEHRIIYYESSRGCPFSCSYCLSSIDKTVRFRSLELVKAELLFFMERRVPQVKFVYRTFNCKKSHAMAIWSFISEHDNGVTNFHFEISADLLDGEMLALIGNMRPGLIQLEIGVQTTNPETLSAIRRRTDLDRLRDAVAQVKRFHNTHRHLDLIAGLPFEDLESFIRSFDDVYRMEPDELQLGFLKVLKGSHMELMAGEYGISYGSEPPYEVLSTRWLDYGDILRLKGVEEMVEVYYNSGQFPTSIRALEKEFSSPFRMFEALSGYYEEQGLLSVSHSRMARYEILYCFVCGSFPGRAEEMRDKLTYDLYLRENVKSRPAFALDQSPYKEIVKSFFIREDAERRFLKGYEGFDSRQLSKMAHLEVFGDGRMVLFDYRNREPLFGNAAVSEIGRV